MKKILIRLRCWMFGHLFSIAYLERYKYIKASRRKPYRYHHAEQQFHCEHCGYTTKWMRKRAGDTFRKTHKFVY